MPELSWNSSYWNGGYDWKTQGEEWSEAWGGSEPQWFGSLYPRLHRWLPSRAILEIAPGYGRWTRFLLPACRRYLGIDLSSQCIAACRDRFRVARYAKFEQNDGLSLEAAPDGAFNLIFTFDSLVHAEAEVIESYVPQILQKLTVDGVAFVHHSNLAALPLETENKHARGLSVSAETVAAAIRRAGGYLLVQERINWGSPHLTDCLTLFSRSAHRSGEAHVYNPHFMKEAAIICETQAPWCSSYQRKTSECFVKKERLNILLNGFVRFFSKEKLLKKTGE